jgi:hypothetical protein
VSAVRSLLERLSGRRDAYLEHATDREVVALGELRRRADAGDAFAAERHATLLARVQRRAEVGGPQPRSPRRRRTRYELLRVGEIVVTTAIPRRAPVESSTAVTAVDGTAERAKTATVAVFSERSADPPLLAAENAPLATPRRAQRPAAVESWLAGRGSPGPAPSERAWLSQRSRSRWPSLDDTQF